MSTNVCAYLRVSTERQGTSGLGLEAQRAAVRSFCERGGYVIAREYVEVESGCNDERPKLRAALAHARRIGAVLLVAKLDRLSRSVKFIATVLDAGVEFRACDMPDASRMVLHIMAAVAEGEAAAISARTRAALAAAKERGVLLGGSARKARGLRSNLTRKAAAEGRARGQEANRAKAVSDYADVLPTIVALREKRRPLRAIADALNRDGFTTRTGAAWSAVQVLRVLDRAA